jgi:O-antigen/teichoic acid export membrane protein
MRIREILKSSSKISGASVLGGLLSAAANIVVARRLGPEGVGVIGLVKLWQLYANFAKPGFLQAAYREMLHLSGQSRPDEARQVQNIALTGEGAFVLIPFGVMLAIGAFHFHETRLRAAMFIAAATFLFTSLYQFADTVQWSRQQFARIAKASLVNQLAQPAFLLGGLFCFGLYGALVAPGLATLLAFAYYLTTGVAEGYAPAWDSAEAWRLMKIGLPMSLYGLLYWGFRTSDSAMVASWLSIQDLGYFTFAMMFIAQGCQLVSDFINVLQANILTELGSVGKVRPLSGKLQRVALLVCLSTGFAAGLSESLFKPVIALVAPKMLGSIPVFNILTLNIVCITVPMTAYAVMISAVVDRQKGVAWIQGLGLALNVALGWVSVRAGLGLAGIAWSSAASQLAAAATAYGLLHGHLFEGSGPAEPLEFYGTGLVLIGAAFLAHFVMDAVVAAPARLAIVAAIWAPAAAALYWRRWAHLHWGAAAPAVRPV